MPAGSVSRHSVSVLAVVLSVVGVGGGVFLVVVGIAVSAGVVLEIMGKNDNESYIIRNTGTTKHT